MVMGSSHGGETSVDRLDENSGEEKFGMERRHFSGRGC